MFVCNHFPSNWAAAGFRPSVWAWGDNYAPLCVDALRTELASINDDGLFRQRCRHMLVCKEQCGDLAATAAKESGLPITFYRRGHWGDATQQVAELGQPIYHWGTTVTDLINLAWIFNPGQEIRMLGFQWRYPPDEGHFYTPRSAGASCLIWPPVVRLHKLGLPLIDCHPDHGPDRPEGMDDIPRKSVLEK